MKFFPSIRAVLFLSALVLLCGSCQKKKTTRTIVTKIAPKETRRGTAAMPDGGTERRFVWDGGEYDASISRSADRDLPLVTDAEGNEYYDNAITLRISGPSGTVLDRRFLKTDFSPYLNQACVKPSASALLNLVFHEVSGDRAVFIATIGSPDSLDDVYVLVEVRVSKSGSVSMAGVEEME